MQTMIQVIGVGGAGTNTIEYLKQEDIPRVEYASFTYADEISEAEAVIDEAIKIVFLTAGMGGNTATSGITAIAKLCRKPGVLTIAVVTTPFSHEVPDRKIRAEAGIAILRAHVDVLIIISNDKLRQMYGNLSFYVAKEKSDAVLLNIVRCVSNLLSTYPGESVLTNIKTFFKNNETMNTDEGKYVARALRAAMAVGIGIYER